MASGLRVLIAGHGRMGIAVEMAATMRGHRVTGFVSRTGKDDWPTVHAALEASPADVVVDFTAGDAIDSAVAGCLVGGVPLVSGTTGWQERLGYVTRLINSKEGALLHATNMSLGARLFLRSVAQAARLFALTGDYDVGIEERYLRGRSGSPSPTALDLARRVLDADPSKSRLATGDPGREAHGLAISSLRVGHDPGRHVVVFDSEDDAVEITHVARGRRGAAMGAVKAAEWLVGRRGVFDLDDLIDDLLAKGG